MSRDALAVSGLVIVIAFVSGLVTFWRAGSIAAPDQLAVKGLSAIQRETVLFYAVFLPVAVGLISFFVYRFMEARWPDTTQGSFLLLAVGIAILLTVLAAVVFRMRGFAELTLLHVVYVAGFGWIMPVLLTR